MKHRRDYGTAVLIGVLLTIVLLMDHFLVADWPGR